MTLKTDSFDVVIVGGAIMGSATAYFLTQDPQFSGRIAIIERDTSYADCSTARSCGGLRQQFSTLENIQMSMFGLDFVRTLKNRFGPEADVSFREQGYLSLASPTGADILASCVEMQRAHGADIVLHDASELETAFPWLSTEGIAVGAYGRSGEGWMDPVTMMTLMRKAAQAKGVTLIHGTVTGFERDGESITDVILADGRRYGCESLVNAAGPDAGRLAAVLGFPLPVERRKRLVFVFDCKDPPPRCPLTFDPTGIYFRPEGHQFISGLSPADGSEWDTDNFDIDHDWFDTDMWPKLAARVPAFETIKVTGAWAGYYDYNTLDQNAIIGRHPDFANLYLMNGSSGHGFQHGPASGRAIAELIVHGAYQTIDLTRLGYQRVTKHEPIFELNVV
ncbi:glycine/D-amino acid oxidase-like deaminating enzyme [Rhodoligotrophos appendicifer]|uniref:NAD(P)/FAD-dependent oxidoreductase n=1 Tax=Rhodoligotrophos appendicifer TaxID=987056 RepID=UPI00117D62A3|nr:FAD-binding oxidoreductase [Rhodoligotrophos appendicifer]